MSFSDFLEKMQHKPRYARARMVWLCVIVSMSLVISVWVLTIKNSLSFNNNPNLSDDAANSLQLIKKKSEQIPSLMNSLKTGVKSLFDKVGDNNGIQVENNSNNKNVNNIKEQNQETKSNQNLDNAQRKIKPKELPTVEE